MRISNRLRFTLLRGGRTFRFSSISFTSRFLLPSFATTADNVIQFLTSLSAQALSLADFRAKFVPLNIIWSLEAKCESPNFVLIRRMNERAKTNRVDANEKTFLVLLCNYE